MRSHRAFRVTPTRTMERTRGSSGAGLAQADGPGEPAPGRIGDPGCHGAATGTRSTVQADPPQLVAIIALDNGFCAVLLDMDLLNGKVGSQAAPLLRSAGAIYPTNIFAFGIWYGELDGAARSQGRLPSAPTQTPCSRR